MTKIQMARKIQMIQIIHHQITNLIINPKIMKEFKYQKKNNLEKIWIQLEDKIKCKLLE